MFSGYSSSGSHSMKFEGAVTQTKCRKTFLSFRSLLYGFVQVYIAVVGKEVVVLACCCLVNIYKHTCTHLHHIQ